MYRGEVEDYRVLGFYKFASM